MVPKKKGFVVEDVGEVVLEGQLRVGEVPLLWILISFLLHKLMSLFKTNINCEQFSFLFYPFLIWI